MQSNTIKYLSISLVATGALAIIFNVYKMFNGTTNLYSGISMIFYILTGFFGLMLMNYNLNPEEQKDSIRRLSLSLVLCIASLFIGNIYIVILAIAQFIYFYSLKMKLDKSAVRKVEESED